MTEPYTDTVGNPAPTAYATTPTVKRRTGHAPQPNGCQHTDDPNGWLMDAQGAITGRCPCWEAPA